MISHQDLQLALRTQLLTLTVTETSNVNLAASGSTITRVQGSFITDGFSAGMEVLLAGWSQSANNARFTITDVEALTLTVDGTLTTESSAAGRTVTVGLPYQRAWENIAFEPTTGSPWIEEQLVPGTTRQITVGPYGTIETRLLYALQVHALEDTGIGAPNRYADALLELFTPRTQVAVHTPSYPTTAPAIRQLSNGLVSSHDLTTWTASGTPVITSAITDSEGGTTAYRVADDSASVQEYIHTPGAFSGGTGLTRSAVFVVREATMAGGGASQQLVLYDDTASTERLLMSITAWVAGQPTVSASTGFVLSTVDVGNGYWAIYGQTAATVSSLSTYSLRVIPASTASSTGSIDVQWADAFNTSLPGTAYSARVRTDTGPYRGQLLRRRPGYATVPITIPLEIWSANTA